MKEQKGITLIALIITIIVVLILVVVTITISLKGGLFGTASDSARQAMEQRILEELISMSTWNDKGEINVDTLVATAKTKYNHVKWEAPKLTITEKNVDYAYKITTTEITVFGSNNANRSEYIGRIVKYDDREWVILWNDDSHGLQLLLKSTGDKYAIEFSESNNGYNSVVEDLNNECEKYVSDKRAIKKNGSGYYIRNVGGPFEDTAEVNDLGSIEMKNGDNNYSEDCDQMKKLGCLIPEGSIGSYSYWLGSRIVKEKDGETIFGVRRVAPSGEYGDSIYYKVGDDTNNQKCAIRPVIRIDENWNLSRDYSEKEEVYRLVSETEDSDYVGKTVYEAGRYWTVLWDDETHGLQLVAQKVFDRQTIKIDGSTNGYNSVITDLNTACANNISDKSKIEKNGEGYYIRNVGCPFEDTSKDSTYTLGTTVMKEADTNYIEDCEQMKKLNCVIPEAYYGSYAYWLGSRIIKQEDGKTIFGIRRVAPSGEYGDNVYCKIGDTSETDQSKLEMTNFIRPVIKISDDYGLSYDNSKNAYKLVTTKQTSDGGKQYS